LRSNGSGQGNAGAH